MRADSSLLGGRNTYPLPSSVMTYYDCVPNTCHNSVCIGFQNIQFSHLVLRSALHQFHTCWWPHRCSYLPGIIFSLQCLLCSSALLSSVSMLCIWEGFQWLNIALGYQYKLLPLQDLKQSWVVLVK